MTMTEVDLRRENYQLKQEIELLKAEIAGSNIQEFLPWLQLKVYSQRKALDALNRRVVTQRFILRTLEELGRGLTRDEYLEARAKQPEKLQERIDE